MGCGVSGNKHQSPLGDLGLFYGLDLCPGSL